MSTMHYTIPQPANEPAKTYAPGSKEREELRQELERQSRNSVDIPLVIGGRSIRTGNTAEIRAPHRHSLKLGVYHQASAEHIAMAVEAARSASAEWSRMPDGDRLAIFLKAAELLAGSRRAQLVAATMLGQSKTVWQSEIDAACELVDFWRFNAACAQRLFREQPTPGGTDQWSRMDFRPLEGFVLAVTPFNFTAIGGNLISAPAMMGNTVLWKPAGTAVLSAHYVMSILREAGLPDGVINLIPGPGSKIGDALVDHPDLAGLNFTGSTATFNSMWKRIGDNLQKGNYRVYPRLVGETGGKDFVLAHPDCDVEALAVALVRGSFEYQGQKCSAASRAYIPRSIWPDVLALMKSMTAEIRMGDVADLRNFMGAVIDKASYENIVTYIEHARSSSDAKIVIGGSHDDKDGWFVSPTVIEAIDPKYKSMAEEIFGPVLTVHVYDDARFDETLALVDGTSPYALTGSIFARDRGVILKATEALRNAAGNFYINDKPTGANVGQQPFGGGRMSGTNDKSATLFNLMRWINVRTIKENFVPPLDFRYPHMMPERTEPAAANNEYEDLYTGPVE